MLDYNSFPGGAYGETFSLGKTATHEIRALAGPAAHVPGRLQRQGDYVADTPSMLVPTDRCPAGKDTCREPGLDPIHPTAELQ